jgi:hypothetical protein
MVEAAKNIRHSDNQFVGRLSERHLQDLYVWLKTHFRGASELRTSGCHYVTEDEMVHDLRRTIIESLVGQGTYDACVVIGELIHVLPEERGYLAWRLHDAELNARSNAWMPPPVHTVISLLQTPHRRYIASARDLLVVVLESLARLEVQLLGTPPAAIDLWSYDGSGNRRDHFRPKDEEDLSDYVVRWLKGDLAAARGIVANREVQPRRGQKTDIWVSAVVPPSRRTKSDAFETCTIVIEVKGCWNADALTAMETQLVERYMKENALRHGINLVAWFLCDRWHALDNRKRATPRATIEEMRELLARQAQNVVRGQSGLQVEAVVLDVTVH